MPPTAPRRPTCERVHLHPPLLFPDYIGGNWFRQDLSVKLV